MKGKLFKFVFLYLFFQFVSCTKTNSIIDNYNIVINEKCQNKYQNIDKDSSYIFFESTFNNDFVEVFLNKNNLFKDTISTDSRLGLAKTISLGKRTRINQISFRINKGRIIPS